MAGAATPHRRSPKRTTRRAIATIAALSLLAAPSVAGAAAPTKGADYLGARPDSQKKTVLLRVAKDGKTATVRLTCSGARAASWTVQIASGRFEGAKRVGGDVSVSLKGSFTSPTTAKAKLSVLTVCDGRGGGPLTLTRTT